MNSHSSGPPPGQPPRATKQYEHFGEQIAHYRLLQACSYKAITWPRWRDCMVHQEARPDQSCLMPKCSKARKYHESPQLHSRCYMLCVMYARTRQGSSFGRVIAMVPGSQNPPPTSYDAFMKSILAWSGSCANRRFQVT